MCRVVEDTSEREAHKKITTHLLEPEELVMVEKVLVESVSKAYNELL